MTIASMLNSIAEGGPKPLGSLLDFAPGATIWTVAAFLVGLVFMWKFVYGPITAALEERDAHRFEESGRGVDGVRYPAVLLAASFSSQVDAVATDNGVRALVRPAGPELHRRILVRENGYHLRCHLFRRRAVVDHVDGQLPRIFSIRKA